MDILNGSSSGSYQEVEPGNLLEECWFFGNLLISSSKSKMSRCNSDPCPSTNQQEFLITNPKPSSTKNDNIIKLVSPKLVRAPSLPTTFMDAKTVQQSVSHDSAGEIMKPQLTRHTLLRAPSLPPCRGKEEYEDEEEEDQESEFKLGRLIRQASLNSSDTLPPRQTSKSSNIPRRPRKKILLDGNKEMGNQIKKGKFPSDIEKKKYEKQSLEDEVSMYKVKSMSDASAWHVMGSSTNIPKWGAAENNKRSSQDVKAQIKFWARAVASNARSPGVL